MTEPATLSDAPIDAGFLEYGNFLFSFTSMIAENLFIFSLLIGYIWLCLSHALGGYKHIISITLILHMQVGDALNWEVTMLLGVIPNKEGKQCIF